MKTNVRTVGNVAVVDLQGKVTIGSGDEVLRDTVQRLLDEGKRKILINLQGVSYMDSAGIGELVACYKRAAEKEGAMRLLKPSGKVFDLLQLTRLTEIFRIHEDEKEAVAAF